MKILFVLAHQDDEIACVSRLRTAVARGDRITCVYLTDGASRVAASLRDAESRQVLHRLGVDDVLFLGSGEGIADGSLAEQFHRADALLDAAVGDIDEVVTLAWEGGHQDHDAAHLLAAVLAHRRGVPCTEMPLYNGHRVRGPFFRVNHAIGEGWISRGLPLRERWSTVLLTRFYPSQRWTWLGLAPLLLLAPSHELTRRADLRRVQARPHPGPLLYERRFHYAYERFAAHARDFLERQSILG